jgi:hypothetical protein
LFALGIATSIVGGNDTPKQEPKKEVVQHEKPKKEKKDDGKSQADKEIAYHSTISNLSMDMADILYDYSTVMDDGSKDPDYMLSTEYQDRVDEVCGRMYDKIQEIKNVDTPSSLQPLQNKLIDAMNEYEFVATETPKAIKNVDPHLMSEVLTHMENGTAKVQAITDEMNDY